MNQLDEQLIGLKTEIMAAVTELKTRMAQQETEYTKKGYSDPETKEALSKAILRLDEVEALVKRPLGGDGDLVLAKSIGEAFIEHAEWKAFSKRGWHKGGFSVEYKNLFEPSTKTTIDTTAIGNSTPGILMPQRVGDIVKPGVRRLRVRDLLPRFPTTANAIEYVKENAFTNAASPQTEASSKVESALTFTIASAPVRTIAHWIPATRQILDDFGQLQAYINTRLIEGLKDKEDSELLTGDGLGVHISGLITGSTAYDTALNVASDTRIDKLRHAIRQVEAADLTCDGIVLHPNDWEVIELIKTEEGGANKGMYLMGGPKGNIAPILWGKPVATTTAMTSGKFLVGAFGTAAAVWDRMDARVDISTEHSDYFVKNMVAIRAEERLALTIFRATSFIYGTF